MALSKKAKAIQDTIDTSKDYSIEEAIELLKRAPKAKFNESVDLSVNLGIDATKSDQGVRGSSTLPHGIGKTMTVVAFADGEDEKAAKDAGADEVGFEDLIDKVKKDPALSRSKKGWAIFFMARRAQSQGKKRMVLLFKKAMQELRQEALDEFMRDK